MGSLTMAMLNADFWFTTLICVILLMLPILSFRFYNLDVHPSLADKIRYKRKMAKIKSRQSNDVLRTPSARRARRSLRSGYAFAHQVSGVDSSHLLSHIIICCCWRLQEGFGRLITSGKMMRKMPQDFAFPLGLGSKRLHPDDGQQQQAQSQPTQVSKHKVSTTGNHSIAAVAPSPDDVVRPPTPYHSDVDTIDL